MKKITIILALLFVGLIQAQPQITFEQEIIDYGRIEKGSDGVRIFKFTNTGNETLIIENINTTPGLSIINKPIGDIIPGGNSIIEVKYDTNIIGPIRKTISIYSNAFDSIKTLRIKGFVQ